MDSFEPFADDACVVSGISHIFKFQVENYPLYILSGQVVFNFFSESTSSAMSSIIQNAPLIKKYIFPNICLLFQE